MVAVRIPGADAIDQVAPARDPGVQATPNDFGANIGTSGEQLGAIAQTLGGYLYKKQADAQDKVFEDSYRVAMDPAAQQAVFDTKAQYPNGGPEFTTAISKNLQTAHDNAIKALANKGIAPSDAALQAVNSHFAGLQTNAMVSGVTYAHNQKITGLQTQLDDNVDLVKSQVLSGSMPLDTALSTVEQTTASGKGLFSGTELVDRKDKWQQGVIDAAIENKTKAGDLAGAQAIKDKYYGATPKYGQNIYSAIYAQESGSGSNTSTSVTGARGGMQIQPATFAQYAKPGEHIDNPADNQAVGKRIIDDLSIKSGGDPARIAVGYFSGPGNIAPPGSPTPWKVDKADPTGKTVSSYVSDVMKRVGASGSAKPVKVASADGSAVIPGADQPNADASGDTADQSSGDNAPILPNVTKSLYWDQQFKAAAVDQKQAAARQQAVVQAASDARELDVFKDIHSDQPQLSGRDILNDPTLTKEAKEKLFNVKQASTGGVKAEKTYGQGFYAQYQRIHAADNDPNRLTDPTELYSHVGPNGDLTVAGVDKLVSEIQGRKTPEGVAEGEMKNQFFKMAKSQISGSDEGLHIKDPKGDELYLKFLAQALPAYDAGRKAGKSATQLLNPDSPDYVGKSITTFKRPMDQWFADTIHDSPVHAGAPQGFDIKKVNSLGDLVTAYQSGKVTKAVADQMAIDRGWAVRKPQPTTSVPVSQ